MVSRRRWALGAIVGFEGEVLAAMSRCRATHGRSARYQDPKRPLATKRRSRSAANGYIVGHPSRRDALGDMNFLHPLLARAKATEVARRVLLRLPCAL